jgi:Thaumarchaeal output domain 1
LSGLEELIGERRQKKLPLTRCVEQETKSCKTAMMNKRAYTQGASAVERVLFVASDAAASAPLCLELMRRGASVSAMVEIAQATAAARQQQFDIILVNAREDANATALLLQVLKAEALGNPKILLLVDPERATDYGQAIFTADEMLASTLNPERIADATGIGFESEAPKAASLPAVFAEPKTKILALPAGISRDLLPKGFAEVERGEIPDAIILTEPNADAAISAWMSAATAAVVPIIDASGQNAGRADFTMTTLSGLGISQALELAKPLTMRMKQLPEAYHRTRDPKQMLLARLAVRDRGMQAKRDPSLKEIVTYKDETAIGGVLHNAEALARLGLLEKKFFEKVQCCPSCTSARLLVREECSKCRSADIVEEPIIHHLRCGYQGPERDFRKDRELVCPKCSLHCEHFSVDYDKPGSLVLCNDCNHATGEAEVGFKCLDCDNGFEGERAKTKVFHEYKLTDAGRQSAFQPPISGFGGEETEADTGGVRDRLKRFVKASEAKGKDCAALMIKVDPDREAVKEVGDQRFHQSLALYASILREVFEKDVEIIEASTTFLVLVNDETASNVEASLPEIRRELEQNITVDLRARYHVFGPDEIATLL